MAGRVKSADKPQANIENWSLERTESGSFYLLGQVQNHPRQADFSGEVQQTSRIVLFDGDNNIAETANTRYVLGAKRS